MLRLDQAPRTTKLILLAALSAFTLGLAAPAAARGGGGGHWDGHDGHRNGPPPGHQRIIVRGNPYYYHGGRYYRPWRGHYVAVRPPVGLVVPVLGPGFRVVVLAGLTYFLLNGIYYRHAPRGYVVVAPPAVAQAPAAVATPTGVVAPAQGAGGTATVIAQALNVRSGPGFAYPVLQVINLGADLTIQGRTGAWLFVRAPNGEVGWVSQQYTTQNSIPASG